MKISGRSTLVAAAMIAVLAATASPAQAGGSFGLQIGFGVSVGTGDWGPYTTSWTNPHWSLNFGTALSGYGEWMWVGGLGKVWRPGVAVGWRPYTHGRWVHTGAGWTWVAYEPWGYIPHHYGSWALCDFGWVWVPGYTYASANVVWVRAGGYVGWYARPPRGWSHAARGYHRGYRNGYGDGYRDGWHDARHATYVDWHHMGSDNISHYAVRHKVASRSRVEIHATRPTVAEVRRRGGATIVQTRLATRNATINGRQVVIARPEGVAGSIERHAPDTAVAALSSAARARRQPMARARPEARSPVVVRSPDYSVDSYPRASANPSRDSRVTEPEARSTINPGTDHLSRASDPTAGYLFSGQNGVRSGTHPNRSPRQPRAQIRPRAERERSNGPAPDTAGSGGTAAAARNLRRIPQRSAADDTGPSVRRPGRAVVPDEKTPGAATRSRPPRGDAKTVRNRSSVGDSRAAGTQTSRRNRTEKRSNQETPGTVRRSQRRTQHDD